MLRVRPRSRPWVATALLVVATASFGACADDVDPQAPVESRSPSALDDPGADSPAAEAEESPGDAGDGAAGQRTDELGRPASWPQGLLWPPVSGRVAEYTSSPDGSLRLVTEVRDATSTLAVKAFTTDWVDSLQETAHSVDTTGGWGGGTLDVVVTAQHPDQVIQTEVTREGQGEPVTVEVLLTPLS